MIVYNKTKIHNNTCNYRTRSGSYAVETIIPHHIQSAEVIDTFIGIKQSITESYESI